MESGPIYFTLLILIIINLFHMFYAQQLTPIIGAKCDINNPEVPIGKGTQFFLKCEQNMQSETGKGVWVVKSRVPSTTTSTTSAAVPVTTSVLLENKQQSQQSLKTDNTICVEDKSARDGDPCSVSPICLQQEQGKLSSNYLQCDQSTNQWVKKSCLDERSFSFEHQACIILNVSPLKQSRLGTRHFVQSAPSSLSGVACAFMQCSQNNPCYRGTCNNGYCCTSANGATFTNHFYTAPLPFHQQSFQTNQFPFAMSQQLQPAYNPIAFNGCSNGGVPVGTCINMRCARGYLCSAGNICCPSNDYGTVISTTANPMKNPFLCTDGTQAAGACILGQCGSPFTCMNGLCCNVTNNTPRCLDGSPSVGACISGQCGAGFICTTGNLCCLSSSNINIIPGTCPNNAAAAGICINGLCPTGYTCVNGQCCAGNTTFRCSNLNYALGPCVADQCPDDGFQCDTTINSCCPVTDPIGPCIEPGDQCPAGNKCFKEGATNLCYKECDGRGTIFGSPADGTCPTGITLIFGSCCILRARLHNPMQASFLPDRHADYYSFPITSGIKLCPDNTGAISACINGQCGYGYQCYNNVCCPPQSTNLILPFSSATLRPIGGSCAFTHQCVSSMESLSICELGICRCLPGAQVNGFSCIRRFSVLLNDAEQSSVNGTSFDEPDVTVADS